MTDPFVYLEVDGLRPVERTMRGGALRLAVHVPDTDRCVEFAITRDGRWTVVEGPDAAHAGGFEPRAEGRIAVPEDRGYTDREIASMKLGIRP